MQLYPNYTQKHVITYTNGIIVPKTFIICSTKFFGLVMVLITKIEMDVKVVVLVIAGSVVGLIVIIIHTCKQAVLCIGLGVDVFKSKLANLPQ